MIRILLVVSPTTSLYHKSGETEVKLLQAGFRLAGFQCDILSIDSDDFETYDMYVIFSLHDDLEPFLRAIDKDKVVIIYPQTENYSPRTLERIDSILKLSEKSLVISRNKKELTYYSNAFGANKVHNVYGWFLEPFIWTRGTNHKNVTTKPYGLLFIGSFSEKELEEIIDQNSVQNYDLVVLSSEIKKAHKVSDAITALPRLPYGSEVWYELLKNCSFFYEKNNRLTNSVLEAAFFQKPIVSPHYLELNTYAEFEIAYSDYKTFESAQKQNRPIEKLSSFRAEKVTFDLVKACKDKYAYIR